MALKYFSELMQNSIGCFHQETDIAKVQVSEGFGHPQYCVLGKCTRCGIDNSYTITRPRDSDYRTTAAAAWLVKHNLDFTTGKPRS